MTRQKLIETNGIHKTLDKNKILIRLKNNYDYTRLNMIGKVIVTEKGDRIGKVLDVLGNVSDPYALVMLTSNIDLNGKKVYVELPFMVRGR
ncbi:H/ACA ribonucleoprotein complex subunit GAR1 [Sulfuracidifex metallicus]|uniref:H/ACA ribonucleoprotein complex subunit GAR1 n=1 Tax=Sulfuracidifex metallicus TaxID=47303 RepID=UPI002276B167|nr:H/ACA RNA-protein complex protein Gar1 [Sulfuracidifex metallicus]MCY0849574.1 H/ACA RNA-protein complex protein Gar1 [Sulfuracidifex metallicus]